jgi:hypothetical protein
VDFNVPYLWTTWRIVFYKIQGQQIWRTFTLFTKYYKALLENILSFLVRSEHDENSSSQLLMLTSDTICHKSNLCSAALCLEDHIETYNIDKALSFVAGFTLKHN